MCYLFMINILWNRSRPCRVHDFTSTCMSITTLYVWFWRWWVYIIDITMIDSYPSIIFYLRKQSSSSFYAFQLLYLLLKILSKFKINYVQLSSIYNRVSSNLISLYLNLKQVRSSTHMAPNFRDIRTLTPSSSLLTSQQYK